MKTQGQRCTASDARGVTLVELAVVVAVVAIIGLGLTGLYLASTYAMNDGSSMAYLQRQGTLIQEELARHIQRATILGVDDYGTPTGGPSQCHPAGVGSLPAGKSIIYQRAVASATPSNPDTDEFWCIYEYKRASDPYAQFWRCQVAAISPTNQVCTSTPENLIATALRGFRGLSVGVSQTCFRPQGLDPTTYPVPPCIPATAPSPLPCPLGCPQSVDVSFALDVQRDASVSTSSIVGGPRQFAFNLMIRN